MVAMIVYGAASAGVAAQIQPILDRVLPRHEEIAASSPRSSCFYLIKGIGAYLSGYLMTTLASASCAISATFSSRTSSGSRRHSFRRRPAAS